MWTFKMNAVNMCVIAQIESSCEPNLKFPKAFILWHLPAYITVNKTKDTLQACANYFGYLGLKLKGIIILVLVKVCAVYNGVGSPNIHQGLWRS